MSNSLTRYKLVFFCPTKSTRDVLDQLFQKHPTRLGKFGEYEQCAFICPGTGQFKPLMGANPTIGEKELRKAIKELKKVHPYEEVAYDVYRIEDVV